MVVLGVIGTVGCVVLLLLVVVLDGVDHKRVSKRRTATNPARSSSPSRTRTRPVSPGSSTTAVLNGTTTAGLAQEIKTRLQNAKFKVGTATNATDQSHSATIVEYASGSRRQALLVAKAIDVHADAVQPLEPADRALAGPDATVVIIAGQDQTLSPQQQTP